MAQAIIETGLPSRVWGRIAGTAGVFAVAMILIDHSTSCVEALAPISVLTARSLAQVLNWMGMGCQRETATLIYPGGFAYEIGFMCTGFIPAGLLATAILVAGGRLRSRMLGAAIGAIGMLLLNLVRLISLFYVGVMAPRFFAALHSVVWQALTFSFVVGFFFAWQHKSALRPTGPVKSASHSM